MIVTMKEMDEDVLLYNEEALLSLSSLSSSVLALIRLDPLLRSPSVPGVFCGPIIQHLNSIRSTRDLLVEVSMIYASIMSETQRPDTWGEFKTLLNGRTRVMKCWLSASEQ